MNRECVTCRHVGQCATVTAQKIIEHYVCHNYEEEVSQQIIQARCDVITKYGGEGLEAIISPAQEED